MLDACQAQLEASLPLPLVPVQRNMYREALGSGSGHGDPADVETGLHSHLIYLLEITVNNRIHSNFP